MPQELIKTNTVSVQYHADYAAIRFSGDVNPDRIFNLCDEIDFAHNYYFYNRVLIEIDSPGGEAKSLKYFVNKLATWRSKGIVIETRALTSCCSAGAYMLSFGNLGYRTALPETSLLYHNARTSTGNSALTVDTLDSIRWSMSVTDHFLLLKLMRHQYGSYLPEQLFDQMHELICCLPDQQRSYDADLLQQFGGKDVRTILSKIKSTSNESEQLQMRRDLHRIVTERLRKQSAKVREQSVEEMLAKHEGCPRQEQLTHQAVWLFGRLEWYQQEFAKDRYIRPEKALSYQLIDRVERG